MPMPDKAHYDEFSTTRLRFGGEWTCVHVPVQAEGRLSDGRPWYFRARCGEWTMQLDVPGAENAWGGRYVDSGDDPWDGFMPAPEAAARIHRVLRWHDNPHAAAVSGCTGTGEDWATLSPKGRTLQTADELPGCTATTAVLEGVGR